MEKNKFDIMKVDRHQKIADIVTSDYNQVLLLEQLEIPLVVGEKTVEEVCAENNINPTLYLYFVNLLADKPQKSLPDFNEDDVQVIIRYLQNGHAHYLNERIPAMMKHVDDVIEENDNPSVGLLHQFIHNYVDEITEHFDYENNVVFPYMKALASHDKLEQNYSVTEYKQHHNDINDALADVKGLLVKYLPCNEAPILRREVLHDLFYLDRDLKMHTKIEDSILIPVVEKFEQKRFPERKVHSVTHSVQQETGLSEREIDVLRLLLEGLSNKEVADRLFISTYTVISHRKNITKKTGIKSLAGLTIYALQHEIINVKNPL